MDLVGNVVNALVIGVVGLLLAWMFKGTFDRVNQRFDRVEQRFDRLEERIDRRIDGLQSSVEAMRSDITQVALAVGVRPRATNT